MTEPRKSLLDAIDEEVADVRFSSPPGAKPIEAQVAKKRAEPVHQMLARVVRKPRTLVLLVLLLAVVIELAMVVWTKEATESLEQRHAGTLAGDVPRSPTVLSTEKAGETAPGAAPTPQAPPPTPQAPPAEAPASPKTP